LCVPETAISINTGTVRGARLVVKSGENLAIGRNSAVNVIVETPDDAFRRVGKVHNPAVGTEAEAVRATDIGQKRVNGEIEIETTQ
jgi:hypothetical protein